MADTLTLHVSALGLTDMLRPTDVACPGTVRMQTWESKCGLRSWVLWNTIREGVQIARWEAVCADGHEVVILND
jgi:hypothetical protein